jgi:hypothetical protein
MLQFKSTFIVLFLERNTVMLRVTDSSRGCNSDHKQHYQLHAACVYPGLYIMYTRDNGPCSQFGLCNLWTSPDTKLLRNIVWGWSLFLALNAPFDPLFTACQLGVLVIWTRKNNTHLLIWQQCLLPQFSNWKRESIIAARLFLNEALLNEESLL